MDMCVQNFKKPLVFLIVLFLLFSCGEMDTILPSTAAYRVNAKVNDLPIDEFSIISPNTKIQPFFNDAVSGDPDVTALMVFFKSSAGEVAGWKVIYTLGGDTGNETSAAPEENSQADQEYASNHDANNDDANSNENENTSDDISAVAVENPQNKKPYKNGDELIIKVKSLDDALPFFPIPSDLPMGKYTLVSHVLSGNQILHKTEKPFFFLAGVNFSLEGIQVHQGGITASSQLVPKGAVIMLEAKLNFDSRLDPYIVWYNGKKIIGEGSFSGGAGNLLWKTPEQSGFFSIRAEAFPVMDRQGLAGYVKDISLLASSKDSDIHLLSEDNPGLLHWYLFEGNLNDSKTKTQAERSLKPAGNIPPRWMPANGTYGLAAGPNDAYILPNVSLSNNGNNICKILFRLKPVNSGRIFSVQFGPSFDVVINLSTEGNNLILTLASPLKSVSETFNLSEEDSFLTAEVNFSVLSDRLSAKLNVIGGFIDQGEPKTEPIILEAGLDGECKIILGSQLNNTLVFQSGGRTAQNSIFTAIWDELALLYMPLAEIENAEAELSGSKPAEESSEVRNPLAAERRPESDDSPL